MIRSVARPFSPAFSRLILLVMMLAGGSLLPCSAQETPWTKAESLITRLTGQSLSDAMRDQVWSFTTDFLFERHQLLETLRMELGAVFGVSQQELRKLPKFPGNESIENIKILSAWVHTELQRPLAPQQREILHEVFESFTQTRQGLEQRFHDRLKADFSLTHDDALTFLENFR